MRKLTIKDAAILRKELEKYGITSGTYQTDYGPLEVNIDLEPGTAVPTVFSRFEDVEKARAVYPKANPYSGKWNFHFTMDEKDEMALSVYSAFINIGAL